MQKKSISIDEARCKRNGLCASLCPVRIFSHEKDAVPQISEPEHCVLCGQCMAIRPHAAVTHNVLEQDRFQRIKEMAKIEPGVVASVLRQRFTKLREFLGIPDHHDVFSAATLGYRGIKLHSTPDRRTSIRFVGG